MERGMTTTMVFVSVVVMSLINGLSAKKLLVGGDSGWISPSSADFYEKWAAEQNFAVGDTLVFKFTDGHTVVTVTSKEAYEKCDPTLDKNPVTVSKGPYEITLTSAGQYYYICTVGSHCAKGQKFAATVSASPDGGSNPSSDSPTNPTPPTKDSASGLTTSVVFVTFVVALVLALLY